MTDVYDVLIIGGGIQGCSVAYFLAREGLKPLVLEKDYCGRHASGTNAGGVRRLGRDLRELELASLSMKYWHSLGEFLDSNIKFEKKGQFKIAMDEVNFNALKERVRQLQKLGYSHEELIDVHELKKLLPDLSGEAFGALYVRDDGQASPYPVVRALKLAATRSGAEILESSPAQAIAGNDRTGWKITCGVKTYSGAAVVNCAGAWAGEIASRLGDNVPLETVCLTLSVTSRTKYFLDGVVGFAGRQLSLKQFSNGTLVIGGSLRGFADRNDNRADVDFKQIQISVANAVELFPRLEECKIVRSWGGLEAFTIDRIPVISQSSKHQSVIHNFGYSAHGFEPAFGSGKVISELLTGKPPSIDLHEFRINRPWNRPG